LPHKDIGKCRDERNGKRDGIRDGIRDGFRRKHSFCRKHSMRSKNPILNVADECMWQIQ